jgi:hypothetical protein
LKDRQIKELIDSKDKHVMNIPDNHNDRMNLLYDLLLMVHADEVVDKNEIAFCEDAVKELGMKKEIVKWLLTFFENGNPPHGEDWDDIRKQAAQKFVLKK